MPGPFDLTFKHLFETYPADLLAGIGLPPEGPAEAIDADLSTVPAAADKILRIDAPSPYFVHLEFQASYDRGLPDRLLRYNVLVTGRHGLPVRSVALLLRRAADGPAMSGLLQRRVGWQASYLDFRYDVIRLWQLPAEHLLAAGLGTLPLAPLANVRSGSLPDVLHTIVQRVDREAEPAEAATLRAAAYVLMGLRYPPGVAAPLLEGIPEMRESSTYQVILAEGRAEGRVEGRVEEARAMLLRLGRKRFGPPDARIISTLHGIADLERLERLGEQLLDVSTWDELLTVP